MSEQHNLELQIEEVERQKRFLSDEEARVSALEASLQQVKSTADAEFTQARLCIQA